jgi:hypothetical protein
MTTFYTDIRVILDDASTEADIRRAWDRIRAKGYAPRAAALVGAAAGLMPWLPLAPPVRRATTLIGVAPPSVPPRTRPA